MQQDGFDTVQPTRSRVCVPLFIPHNLPTLKNFALDAVIDRCLRALQKTKANFQVHIQYPFAGEIYQLKEIQLHVPSLCLAQF